MKQPGFTYSAGSPFAKNKERIKKFKETGESRYIYQNELEKACFQHDMSYEDFKDLNRKTAADIIIRDLILLKIQIMMDINVVLLQWFIIFLIKKLQVEQLKIKYF